MITSATFCAISSQKVSKPHALKQEFGSNHCSCAGNTDYTIIMSVVITQTTHSSCLL